MALDLHFQEQIPETAFDVQLAMPLDKSKTFDDEHEDALLWNKTCSKRREDDLSAGFECNICLDLVNDPVVTFCGHLYCWPCIYKWIQFQSTPSDNKEHRQPQCPVCKAEVSHKTLIPLYGRGGQSTKPSEDEVPSKSMVIPQRPSSPRCGGHTLLATAESHPSQLHHRQQSQMHQSYTASIDGATRNVLHPMIGEMVYAQVFGNASPTLYAYPNSYHQAGSSSLRMRRQLVHADRSLGRLCFFLCLCVVICLLLY